MSKAAHARRGFSDFMRILHLANHCGKANGHVNVSVDMACIQAKNGHQIAYGSSGGDFVPLMESYGITHFTISQPHRGIRNYLQANAQLYRALKSFRPDVVHIHMAAQSVLMQPFRLLGFKTVTTIHNEFDKSVWLMGLASRIVTVSTANAGRMQKRGFSRSKIRTVINGSVGSPRLPAEFKRADLQHPAILTVCGMHDRKGVSDLLQAFQMVLPNHPAARLYLAGEGPSQERYERLAQTLGISERCKFLGYQNDPRQFLYAADIFVLASHADPGPLVIAEARNAGCAMIGTNVDGIPEMLDHGAAGILVEPKKPEQIAKAIAQLLETPSAIQNYSNLARHNVERFTIDRVCREMDAIYEEIAPRPTLQAPRQNVESPSGQHIL